MKLSVHSKDCDLWNVIDLDTGKRIRGVQFADDKRGVYIVFKKDETGKPENCSCSKCGNNHVIEEIKHRNIKLVRKSKEEQDG